jgi:hypothetical protein
MKYKLINSKTKEEHLCDKVTIDGFDYYVSEEEIKVGDWYTWDGNKNSAPSLCTDNYNETSILESKEFTKFFKVITTNNPNIDIPKIVDEILKLSSHYINSEEIKSKKKWNTKQYFEYDLKNVDLQGNDEFLYKKLLLKLSAETSFGFIDGYNKSQETHPFSEDNVIDFLNWISKDGYPCIDKTKKNLWVFHPLDNKDYTPKELIELWKEQQPKIIYYE